MSRQISCIWPSGQVENPNRNLQRNSLAWFHPPLYIGAMSDLLSQEKFPLPLDAEAVAADWRARGYSCKQFVDPPGQQWLDFTHATNELVVVVEGRLEMVVGGERVEMGPGDEIFIPARANHSVINIHPGTSHWLFGYD